VANSNIAFKCNGTFYVNSSILLYPAKLCMSAQNCSSDDDDVTIVTSNTSSASSAGSYKRQALQQATFTLPTHNMIADSGATQFSIMEGTLIVNK
jgi:hypothetical protein